MYFFYFFLFYHRANLFRSISYMIKKRTDYPGKEIARLVQNKWDDNFVMI